MCEVLKDPMFPCYIGPRAMLLCVVGVCFDAYVLAPPMFPCYKTREHGFAPRRVRFPDDPDPGLGKKLCALSA